MTHYPWLRARLKGGRRKKDVNAAPGASRAALSYYRAILSPEGLEASRARAERKLDMPILAFGA